MPFLINLTTNSNIRTLSIDQNPFISDLLFANLITEESNLKSLSLRGNQLGDAGVKALANSLKVNRYLLHLSLWDNKIQKEGCEALSEASVFSLCKMQVVMYGYLGFKSQYKLNFFIFRKELH
jgi:Ran GTPase-activating protein (RanGAP) involved in mRNA processing and transport